MHRFTYEDGARLLTSELALPDLSLADAMSIVPRMRLTLARPDAVLFRAGGPAHLDEQTRARLSVLMKLERRLGVSSGGIDSVPPAGKP